MEHPNQLPAATLIHTIDRQVITNAQAISTIQSPTRSTYTLSSHERIATLEAKLFNLCQNKNTSIAAVKTRAQRANPLVDEEEAQAVANARKAIPRIEEVNDIDANPKQPTVTIPNSSPIIPEHPYHNA